MYIKHNLNPKNNKTGDCVVRALGLATGLGWDKTYLALSEIGFRLKLDSADTKVIEYYLVKILGWKIGTIKISKGDKRPTVDEFARNNPNIHAILRVANHLTCCYNGNYVDIWDCGKSVVYKYWYKEEN